MTEKRLVTVACIMVFFAFLLQWNMTRLACGDYYKTAEKQTVKSVELSAGRADIVDCKLRNITGTENTIKALVTKKTNLQEIFENIRDEDREKFYNRIQRERSVVVDLVKPVDTDTIYTVSQRYSSANIAQHLIGYTDLDGNGLTGIEKAYDSILKDNGEKITLHFNVNGNGDIYGNVWTTREKDGNVLALTIDNSIQRLAESVAKENIANGSIVVMECKTGKIRAMASTPVYDANNIVPFLTAEKSPMVNKALSAFEPGSVIKPLWAAVLIDNGFGSEAIYECKGYTEVDGHIFHCANDRAHGKVNMEKALVVSCNCYFIDRYIKNKGYIFSQTANQVNFGRGIKLCDNYYTGAGTFPSPEKLINTGMLASVSFGQGDFLVTPVHIAAYMNIFANDGIYVRPQIADGVYSSETAVKKENLYSYSAKRVIGSSTAEKVKKMLINVAKDGAGGRAKAENFTSAGKTGTAQTGKMNENGEEIFTAWFCGFYPGRNPEYVICITMYDGGESTYSAAPLFKKMCDGLYYLKYTGENQQNS